MTIHWPFEFLLHAHLHAAQISSASPVDSVREGHAGILILLGMSQGRVYPVAAALTGEESIRKCLKGLSLLSWHRRQSQAVGLRAELPNLLVIKLLPNQKKTRLSAM